ncbi:MAG: hypothetical protein HKP61_19355 [Dactylosporangium sp.]|nr:hypothetical protein [Dactylosporangium sp.]NNJ63047.1 hypothetical protein [Dactylosporangium sp.]
MSSPRSEDTAAAWFARMSLLHRPGFWIPVLVMIGFGAYHLVWWASDTPYSSAALITLLACVVAALLMLAIVRSSVVALGTSVKFFLAAVGFGAAVLGVDLVIGPARVGTETTTDVVGALALLGGLFVFSAGIYLRTDVDRPSAIRPGPRHVAEERFRLNGADAVLRRFRDFGPGTNRLVDVCRPQITAADLHFVAYSVDGECRFYLDVLEDSNVDRFFDQVTPETRREHYLQQARYLHRLMTGLNASFREIDAGILIRVVLDVERGALYYYWIDDRRFMTGVTLDQEMVDAADRKMVHVVDEVRVSLGHKRIGDLER